MKHHKKFVYVMLHEEWIVTVHVRSFSYWLRAAAIQASFHQGNSCWQQARNHIITRDNQCAKNPILCSFGCPFCQVTLEIILCGDVCFFSGRQLNRNLNPWVPWTRSIATLLERHTV